VVPDTRSGRDRTPLPAFDLPFRRARLEVAAPRTLAPPWTRAAIRRRTGPPEPRIPPWSGGPCGPSISRPRRACSIRPGTTADTGRWS